MQKLSPLQPLSHPLFDQHNLKVSIKRDDLIHPVISGNKWRKLKYNINHVINNGYKGILSFGGSYSNHIHALAFAGKKYALRTHAIIRGEQTHQGNYTLASAKRWGMELSFVDRKTYQKRSENEYLQLLKERHSELFIVPEGGSNQLALTGVGEVITELDQQCSYDTLITPVGSGGTLAGLINQDDNRHQLLGIAVLKQQNYLVEEVNTLLGNNHDKDNWQILNEFHCGGYAKFSSQDLALVQEFSQLTKVPFEPIYSGKMILALLSLIKRGYFKKNQHIVLLHTGGLQGLVGLKEQGRISEQGWQIPPALEDE